jgi:hypothetical protein
MPELDDGVFLIGMNWNKFTAVVTHESRNVFHLFAARVRNGNNRGLLLNLNQEGITMGNEEQGKKMGQIIAKCWADESFKQKLLADPAGTLKAEGAELPAGLTVKAVENTDQVFHLVIPAKPTDLSTDLSDDDLDKVAGGGPCFAFQWCGCL